MIVYLSPFGGAGVQFFDNNGIPLSGGKIYTYLAGSSAPSDTYTTSAGNIAHSNPIILDSSGRVSGGGEIWLKFASYKFVLKTSADVVLGTWDNISGIGASVTVTENFSGNGSTVSFTLANPIYNENVMLVYINGVYQQRNTYSVSNTTLLFSEAPPITSSIEVLYS